MKRKRRPLTLIEVTIAFVVLGAIFLFLFSPFSETAKMSGKIETATREVFSKHHFQARLTQLLSYLDGEITCKENTLTFSTSLGTDPDIAFSGSVCAALTLSDGDLILEMWPKEEEKDETESLRTEILLSEISKIEYTFHALENGKYTLEKNWESATPPDAMSVTIDEIDRYAFHISKTSDGIAL